MAGFARRQWNLLRHWYRNSVYSRAVVYLVLFLLGSSVLVLAFEVNQNEQFTDLLD